MKKRRSAGAYLWDIVDACDKTRQFTAGGTLETYTADAYMKSAVERQLMIVGEAIVQLLRQYPDYAEHFPTRSAIIAFRNRLVHSYEDTADAIVWGIVIDDVPELRAKATRLLNDPPN
ncbi:HepT-like ribonuclease domain-containing protein [Emcibacter sp. SYSU 3D8]|uniref:HepT-like ribonuclease domain-containing protein n=1 Tax=Emcibacter sp. SYSU 3D8 TaxID=3133969 RepID=UPI0031FEB126